MRLMIAGGGTGGHIFPAIAVAEEFKKIYPSGEVLFIGAEGGMEEKLIPEAGYEIKSVWISGLRRRLNFKNIVKNASLPLKFLVSARQADKYIKEFKPDAVLGVGGYAAYPTLNRAAAYKNIRTGIMEQNAFPGLTNRRLSGSVQHIFLGTAAAAKHFKGNENKIIVTGNPVRADMFDGDREIGVKLFNLFPDRPTILALGGSLGAKTINDSFKNHLELFKENGIQIIWQCGNYYYEELKNEIQEHPLVHIYPFIKEMNHAYAAGDLIVARAGALTIAEIEALAKPSILIPSPNVADDHQTHNAMALVESRAAVLLTDNQAIKNLGSEVIYLLNHPTRKIEMASNALKLYTGNSAEIIVRTLFNA